MLDKVIVYGAALFAGLITVVFVAWNVYAIVHNAIEERRSR